MRKEKVRICSRLRTLQGADGACVAKTNQCVLLGMYGESRGDDLEISREGSLPNQEEQIRCFARWLVLSDATLTRLHSLL